MQWEAIVVIIIIVGMLTSLAFELLPPELTVLTAMLLVWNIGACPVLPFLASFAPSDVAFADRMCLRPRRPAQTGIITVDEALGGFANEGMITVGALFVVVKGVEKRYALVRLFGGCWPRQAVRSSFVQVQY